MADETKKAKVPPTEGSGVSDGEKNEGWPQQENVAPREQDAIGKFIARHLRTLKGLSNR